MSEPEFVESPAVSELETRCNIDLKVAQEEALWYSVMNVLAVSLGSGMGIEMDQADVNSLLNEAGISQDQLSMANPSILKAVFKNGDPHLMKKFQPNDLSTWQWSPESFDKELVPQAQGWTIIAETECAKWFGLTEGAESLPADFRRNWEQNSLLLWLSAQAQCDFAFDNLRNEQGLFALAAELGSVRITDSGANLEDQACMLWACSDLVTLASKNGSVFKDGAARSKYLDRADQLFHLIAKEKDSLLSSSVNKVQARSIAIPALIWYASVTENQGLKAGALRLLRQYADDLVKAQDNSEMVGDTLVDAAAALQALAAAFRVTKLRTYADSAVNVFNFIESQWWKLPGVYAQTLLSPKYTYNADDVGTIAGALNAARLFLKDRVNRELIDIRLRVFFCNAVNLSGLQMSMPSIEFLPQWIQQREPSMHFRHDSLPLPSEAGGEWGMSPVFAGEVAYDPQSDTWSRRMTFDVQAAMRACCEFIWLSHDTINGFPEIDLQQAPLNVKEAVGWTASV